MTVKTTAVAKLIPIGSLTEIKLYKLSKSLYHCVKLLFRQRFLSSEANLSLFQYKISLIMSLVSN